MAHKRTRTDKILEKIPPLIGYLIFVFIIVSSIFAPFIAAIAIISVNVYFFYRSLAFLIQFAIGLNRIKVSEKVDWIRKLDGLENIPQTIENLKSQLKVLKDLKYSSYKLNQNGSVQYIRPNKRKHPSRILFLIEKRKAKVFIKKEIKSLEKYLGKDLPSYKDLKHVIIIPHVKEPMSILRNAMEYLKGQTFPLKQITVVLAAEARDAVGVENSYILQKEYSEYFDNVWVTAHEMQDEDIVGKSSNMAWAGRRVYEKAMELGWDTKKTTITSCDADSKFDHSYFAYMSYKFITAEERVYKYFTAAMVFYNNIWRLKFYARVKNSLSSIYNVGRMIRTDKLVPFSTYTLSLWLVEQVDFWTPWVVPEDFHMFFKAVFKFDSKVETIPIYLVTMSDAAEGTTHWETIVNNYTQSRRWSWGISDDGWMIKTLFSNWRKYSIKTKYLALHIIFDHITGPVITFLILVGGNIPPLLNDSFQNIPLGASLPNLSSTIIRFTMVFMVLIIILDYFLKPKRKDNTIIKTILTLAEWPFITITGVFLTALPGIDAHTRLLFGKYMEHYVTVKKDDEPLKK